MPTAKKLPSGSWRCQVYSHSVTATDDMGNIIYDKDGKPKKKRIYESFTSDDNTKRGKVEAENMANDFILNRKDKKKKNKRKTEMTLIEAIDKYIDQHSNTLSVTTIKDYKSIKKNGFQDIMHTKLKDFDEDLLQSAVNRESGRKSKRFKKEPKTLSPKRLKNEYGLVRAVLKRYGADVDFEMITLPDVPIRYVELIKPEDIIEAVKGTEIELAVLLAMWLSFSRSEVLGLTKSKSVDGDYLTIKEVIVNGEDGPEVKEIGKNKYRNRRHRIPAYIKNLINQVEGDRIVPIPGWKLYREWTKCLKRNNLPHITFHDLRHVNASVMALLRIPDKYAQERGGWKSDKVMKKVYQQTFSDERKKVDEIIDNYFDEKMQHEMQHEKENPT